MVTDESPKFHVPHEDFTIGEWLVESSLDRLSRAGAVVHLRPQLTDLLLLLARHAGRTVPKHVILGEVWGCEYVGESALTRCIAELRQAFGDDARQPTVIETIPKRGYRLIAPVAFLPAGVSAASGVNGHDSEAGEASCAPFAEAHLVGSDPSAEDAGVAIVSQNGPTRAARARHWLRDLHWKVLLALAVVVGAALAAGRCGPREAVAKHPATGQTELRQLPRVQGALEHRTITRGSGRVDAQQSRS